MNPPLYPEFKPVGLEDRALFLSYQSRVPIEVCEMVFGNIFIWRNYDHPRYSIIRDNLCVRFEPPDEPAYFLQPFGTSAVAETIRTCLEHAPRLSRIPASFAGTYCSEGFRCDSDRDNFDYVYETRDLIALKGKKYDGKRNRIRKFERSHAFRYVELEADHLESCRRLFEEWAGEKESPNPMAGAQQDAIQQALSHFGALEMSGGAIEVEGAVAAFSIGEPLNADTAVIHIEIVSPKYEGLAQLMNREFVRNGLSSFAFINREQDMGVAGLRKAKESYQPHHLIEKYHVRL